MEVQEVVILAFFLDICGVHVAKAFFPSDEIHELLAFGEHFAVQEPDLIALLGSSGVEKGVLVREDALKAKQRDRKLIFNNNRFANR
jgi:hypothetical protein